ncbi:MAG: hypothetical protein ACK5PP_18010 [Acidimicrobiales bacterium]
MTPTLIGRIQTRLFLLVTVGAAWTILVVPFLPRFGASIGAVYTIAFFALILVGVVGVGTESVYHALQQRRWEKDWPILFGLLTGLPEFLVIGVLIAVLIPGANLFTVFLHFTTTWVVIWLAANGPMRVLLLRWRYQGGKVL